MLELLNSVGNIVALVMTMWQIFDPRNGLLAIRESQSRQTPLATLRLLLKSVFQIIVSYCILTTGMVLTNALLLRSFDLPLSPFFPDTVIDYKSMISYYRATSENYLAQRDEPYINMQYTGLRFWVCYAFYIIVNGLFMKNSEPYIIGLGRSFGIFVLTLGTFFFVSFFLFVIILVVDRFINVPIIYWAAFKTFMLYVTFFTLPIIMYWFRRSNTD